MDRNLIHDQIDSFLETIKEQHYQIKKGQLHQIELDIMMAEVRKLYDCCRLLQNTSNSIAQPVNKEPETPKVPKQPVKNQEKAPVPEPVTEPVINMSSVEPESIPVSSSQLEIPMKAVDKTFNLAPEGETKKESQKTIATQVKAEPALNEKFAKKADDKTLAEKLQNKSVKDLKEVIGINEKFAFIHQLFKGDPLSYLNAIDYLNSCTSAEAANEYLNSNVIPKFQWDKDNELVMQFLDLIQRRFI